MPKLKFFKYWQILLIIAFTTMLYPIAIGPFSGLMLFMMFFSVGVYFFAFPNLKKDNIPLVILFLSILFSALIHIDSFRFSTIAYSFLLIATFACYRRLLTTNALNVLQYLNVIHCVVYAYAIVLFIQQVSVIVGIPPLNRCWAFSNPFKLNSLAHEPSYVGGTLTLLMYSHVRIWRMVTGFVKNKEDFLKNRFLWFSYLYVCLTNCSAWTIFALFLMILYLFRKQKKILSLCIVVGAGLFSLVNMESMDRLVKFIPAIFTGDTAYISSVDLSASARINPILYYIQDINLDSFDFWFGHGVDYSKSTIIVRLLETDEYMEQGNATGGMTAFFYDFGFVSLIIFFFVLRKYALKKWISFPFAIWIFFFLYNGFNTYLTWMFFMITSATLFYENSRKDLLELISVERRG